MNKAIKEIMIAMGDRPIKKKKIVRYVDEDEYNDMAGSDAENEETSDLEEMQSEDKARDPSMDPMAKLESIDPAKDKSRMQNGSSNGMDESIDDDEMMDFDDDTESLVIKKMGRLFGNDLSSLKNKLLRK